jgi:hypothetical protein
MPIKPVYDGGEESWIHRLPLPILVTDRTKMIPGLPGRSMCGFDNHCNMDFIIYRMKNWEGENA